LNQLKLFEKGLVLSGLPRTTPNFPNTKIITARAIPSLRRFPPGQLRTFLAEVVLPKCTPNGPTAGAGGVGILVQKTNQKIETSGVVNGGPRTATVVHSNNSVSTEHLYSTPNTNTTVSSQVKNGITTREHVQNPAPNFLSLLSCRSGFFEYTFLILLSFAVAVLVIVIQRFLEGAWRSLEIVQ
jgi:hypothetical protein